MHWQHYIATLVRRTIIEIQKFFVRIRLKGANKPRLIVKNELTRNYSCLCFFVMFCTNLDSSRRRFLQSMRKSNAYIVLVNNKTGFIINDSDTHFIDAIYENSNRGMDIGGFKHASETYIERYGVNDIPEKIVYANDSLFFLGGDDSTFAKLLDPMKPWVGLFENSGVGGKYHVSSWLFSISKELFLDPALATFWHTYTPINNKFYSIHKGEHGLSMTFLKLGYTPSVIYSNEILLALIDEALRNNFEKNSLFLSTELISRITSRNLHFDNTRPEWFIYLIHETLFTVSPMHACQLLLLDSGLCAFIKKDLFWNQRLSYAKLPLLQNILEKRAELDLVQEIMNYYLVRGRLCDARLFAKLRALLGIGS